LDIVSVDASPFPLKSGVPTTIAASANLKEDFTAGTYNLVVKLDGFQILSKSGDACAVMKGLCPTKAGKITFNHEVTIPSIAPSGDYSIEVTLATPDNAKAACYSVDLKLNSQYEKVIAPFVASNSVQVGSPVPINKCADGTLNIVSVDVTPFPIKSGVSTTVVASAQLAKDFTAGTYDISLKLGGFQLFSKSGDACALLTGLCPLKAGPFNITKSFTIPSLVPSGDYSISATVKNSDSSVAACYTIST